MLATGEMQRDSISKSWVSSSSSSSCSSLDLCKPKTKTKNKQTFELYMHLCVYVCTYIYVVGKCSSFVIYKFGFVRACKCMCSTVGLVRTNHLPCTCMWIRSVFTHTPFFSPTCILVLKKETFHLTCTHIKTKTYCGGTYTENDSITIIHDCSMLTS